MERRGKSSPERGRPRCHVNPIRCNTDWEVIVGPALPTGGWSKAATSCRDRLSHTTELGLSAWSYQQEQSSGAALSFAGAIYLLNSALFIKSFGFRLHFFLICDKIKKSYQRCKNVVSLFIIQVLWCDKMGIFVLYRLSEPVLHLCRRFPQR